MALLACRETARVDRNAPCVFSQYSCSVYPRHRTIRAFSLGASRLAGVLGAAPLALDAPGPAGLPGEQAPAPPAAGRVGVGLHLGRLDRLVRDGALHAGTSGRLLAIMWATKCPGAAATVRGATPRGISSRCVLIVSCFHAARAASRSRFSHGGSRGARHVTARSLAGRPSAS